MLPANLGAGYLNVTSNGEEIGTIAVPVASVHQTISRFELNLTGITSKAGYSPLTFTFVQTASAALCGPLVSLIMDHLQVAFSGELHAPTTISTFFPSVIHDVALYVQAPLTPALEQAALNIAASSVHRFNPMPFSVSIHAWDPSRGLPAISPMAFERVIAIRRGVAGVHLRVNKNHTPILVLTGHGAGLVRQSEDLIGVPYALSQSTSAVVTAAGPVTTLSGSQKTFSQLGISGSFSGAGQNSLYLGIDQSLFGGNASSYAVHLGMNYSPVSNGDRGNAVAQINGVVVASTSLNSTGRSYLDFTIPSQSITRVTGVNLIVSYFPVGGICTGGYRTIQFSVDPHSTVTLSRVTTGLGGFVAVPSALTPTFQVSFDRDSFTRLAVACSVITGLGQLTNQLLVPSVTPWRVAQNNGMALLAVGDSHFMRFSDSPLVSLHGTTIVVDAKRNITLNPNVALASLSVFADNAHNRTVLAATTSGSWDLFNPIFAQLGNTSSGWQGLTGDTLAAGPGGQVVNVAILAGLPADQQFQPIAVNGVVWLGILLSLLALLGFLLLGAWLIRRYYRRKRAGRVDGDKVDESDENSAPTDNKTGEDAQAVASAAGMVAAGEALIWSAANILGVLGSSFAKVAQGQSLEGGAAGVASSASDAPVSAPSEVEDQNVVGVDGVKQRVEEVPAHQIGVDRER